MPLTRSKTRQLRASQPLVETGTSTNVAPHPTSLGSPVQLKRGAKRASPSLTPKVQQAHHKLERAMSSRLPQVLADTTKPPPDPIVGVFRPKPLERYQTPRELVGNAVNDPALLNAPKADRVRRPRRESSSAAALELSEQNTIEASTTQRQQTQMIPSNSWNLDVILEDREKENDRLGLLAEQEQEWMMEFTGINPEPSFDDQEKMSMYLAEFHEFMKRKVEERGY